MVVRLAEDTVETAPESLESIVLRAQMGDRDAFGELFTRFEQYVFTIALRRLGNEADAREMVQDAFVQALEKIDQLKEPKAFGGWIRTVVTRMSINKSLRTREYVGVVTPVDETDDRIADDLTPPDALLQRERAEYAWQTMSKMKESDQEALALFYLHGRSLKEMVGDLNVPMGTVKRRLFYARQRFETIYRELMNIV